MTFENDEPADSNTGWVRSKLDSAVTEFRSDRETIRVWVNDKPLQAGVFVFLLMLAAVIYYQIVGNALDPLVPRSAPNP